MQKKSTEKQFPAVSVDLVLLTVKDDKLQVALAAREPSFKKGQDALIGGTVDVDQDDDLEGTVARILKDRGGLSDIFVEQLYSFGGKARDPRGWSVAVAYYGLIPVTTLDTTAKHFSYYSVDDLPPLPFDHAEIVKSAVERVRGKGGYSTIPARLLDKEFTLSQMRDIYAAVLGTDIEQNSFRRKVIQLGIVTSTKRKGFFGRGDRPSEIFTLTPGVVNFDRSL